MIKINKPKFWDKKHTSYLAIILFPFSLVVSLIIFLKKKMTKMKEFKIPVICVGNIYLGGTGKTPTSIFLAKELEILGLKPVLVRKYYENHKDEHDQIKHNFKNLILCNNRIDGLNKAKEDNFKTAILDDGLQDYAIKKNLSIACFNENQLVGNGLILPAGPLRESLKSLQSVDIILINGKKNRNFENKILNINKNLKIFYSNYRPINIDEFKNKKLLVIAGIANPDNFFQLLEENELLIEKKLIFPDHYQFKREEIQSIIGEAEEKKLKIIMTEKDYFKLNHFKLDKINYLKVSLEINKKENFINEILKINDKIN